jgi:hypothetical protein
MNRVLIVGFAVVLLGGMAWVHSAQDATKDTDNVTVKLQAKVQAVANKPAAKAQSLPAKLASRVNFDGFNDPRTTFQDALDSLSDKFDVRFDVDENAFRALGIVDRSVLNEPIAQIPVPLMRAVQLETLIRKVLARLPSQPGKEPTYIIQGDTVLITTADVVVSKVWGSNYRGPMFPLVHPQFEEKRLDEVIKDLAEASGHNISVDKRLGSKAQVPVSIKMTNAPLDTVIRLLADMTDLDTVFLDNVIYVTTKENAEIWNRKLQKEQQDRQGGEVAPPRIGTVPPVPMAPGSVPPGA